MDKNMTLEKRIAAELYCYQGKMSVFVDDLQGHTVEVGADEEFETASTIKAFILAALYLQAQRGKADLAEEITYEQSQFVDGSGMLRALGVGAKLKVKDTATMMIICSDNIATNMIIDYLGLDTINACIRELGFAHTVLHNPLHFDRYRRLGTTTPRDYAALFARIAKGELVSREASAEMLAILRQQHYNTMLTHDFPQYYLDCEETGAPELIWVASKSGSMNACRNDGGIVHTPYGEYVIVLMNKDFHDIIEYNEHPAMVYGARVSRMILDQVLACEGRLSLSGDARSPKEQNWKNKRNYNNGYHALAMDDGVSRSDDGLCRLCGFGSRRRRSYQPAGLSVCRASAPLHLCYQQIQRRLRHHFCHSQLFQKRCNEPEGGHPCSHWQLCGQCPGGTYRAAAQR